MKDALTKLLSLKSIITLALTGGLLALLFGGFNPPQEVLALYCTTYGATITYYFTRKDQ